MRVVAPVLLRARLFAVLGIVALLALPSASVAGRGFEWNSLGRIAGGFTPPVPENYNARLDPTGEASKLGSPVRRTDITEAERTAVAALAARVPELHVSRDEVSQYPTMVLSYAPGGILEIASDKTGSPEATARGFLSSNAGLYGMSDDDLASLQVRYVTSPEGGATIVKFDQVIDGLPIYGDDLSVAMTKANDIVATSGRMYPQVAAAANARAQFAVPATDAIVRAVADLTGRSVSATDFKLANASLPGDYKSYAFVPDRGVGEGRFLSADTRVRQVLYPLGAGHFVAAWYLELWVEGDPGGSGPVFAYVIAADDGRLLFRNNLVAYDTYNYRVYADNSGDYRPWDGPTGTIGTPHPTGTPNGFQAPFIAAPLVSVESLLGPTDPWLPSGATETTGNNTDAYLDLALPNGFGAGDLRGTATTAGSAFDYQYDSTQNCEVTLNREAAVVGMFYQVNWLHDIWYRHGFTEAAGNAQTNNYGRGGTGGDPVLSEGQDRSGTDNANMATPADGGSPRMQMFKFLAGGRLNPTRDGTFDMLIVGHEMGHYLSNRLIGNGGGLGNRQGGSMGEGWGDFDCELTTIQDTDNLEGTTFAVGGQTDIFWCGAAFMDNYYFSIRRYPYSSDKLKNPFTFKDIGPGITTYPGVLGDPCTNLTSSPSEVHNAGEIWAEMQFECLAQLARAYGTKIAREKMFSYMIDGMKLTPPTPTFVEARDGYIAAANAANGFANPKDTTILWKAFSKRGIGTGAVPPIRTSTTHAGIVEDFTAAAGVPDDTVGVYTSGVFFERDVLFGGIADQVFSYGAGGLKPLVGNWDGGSAPGPGAADTPGLYDPATGTFFLKNTNAPGPADTVFGYGPGGPAVPVVGDWDGDGTTTVGVYLPATSTFFLKNSNAAGSADIVFSFGAAGSGFVPIAGDWDGNGVDTVGLYDPATGNFFLKNTNAPGSADLVFSFGIGGGVPLAGDWNSDGVDTIGLYAPGAGVFFLRNSNSGGFADEVIGFGPAGAVPVAGNFDGQ